MLFIIRPPEHLGPLVGERKGGDSAVAIRSNHDSDLIRKAKHGPLRVYFHSRVHYNLLS